MSLTLDQIVAEAQQWPDDVVAELVDRLMLLRHGVSDPELGAAWQEEVRRRIGDIQSGRAPGLSAEDVMAKARKILGR